VKQKAKGPKGDCTITAEQLLQAPETYHQDAHPCKEPIEARGVCRRHYSMLKRFNPDGLAPKATNQRAQAATARVKPAREIPEGEAATRADFRGDAPLVNRIHDYDTYQTYVTDTSKPKSKVKLSTHEVTWAGTAMVDIDGAERATELTDAQLTQRDRQRVNAFLQRHADHGFKPAPALNPADDTSPLDEQQRSFLRHLLYNAQNPMFDDLNKDWLNGVLTETAGDYRERLGYDRLHSRRKTALRQIDLVKAGKKIGLADESGNVDLGDDATLQEILAAIETNRVRS